MRGRVLARRAERRLGAALPRNSSQRRAPARSAFGGRFGDQHGLEICCGGAAARSGELPPDRIFGNENACAGMLEELPLLFRGELVIEWNEHAAAIENRVRGDQPLGLIGHDDRRAVARLEARFLQRFR